MILDFGNIDFQNLKHTYSQDEYYSKVLDFLDQFFYSDFFVSHTSGSTGSPKEVRIDRHRAIASAAISNRYFEIHPSSYILLCLHIDTIAAKMQLVRAYQAGASVMVVHPTLQFYSETQGKQFDFVSLTPYHIQHILDHAPDIFQHIRKCLIGGGAISPLIEKKIKNLFPHTHFYESYGMTETMSHIAIRDISGGRDYFEVLKGYEITTTHEGRLVVYHRDILPHRITTNDIIEQIDDTKFRYLGRADDIVNSGGLKLNPESLESILKEYIHIPFILAGEPDILLGQRLILILRSDNAPIAKEEIWAAIRQSNLPHSHLPKEIYQCQEWAETDNFKPIRAIIIKNKISF